MLHAVITFLTYALSWLFVITMVITIHELAHYFAARACGVKVERASLGFGKPIFQYINKKTGVIWQLCWIPLGGYVKFAGDPNVAGVPDGRDLEDLRRQIVENEGPGAEKKYYHFKTVWQRAIIAAAGPISNFILSILLFGAVYMAAGEPLMAPRVHSVVPGSAAAAAGFKPGDLITRIGGQSVNDDTDVRMVIMLHSGDPLAFTLQRDGKPVTLTATPRRGIQSDKVNGTQHLGQLGIFMGGDVKDLRFQGYNPLIALQFGVHRSWTIVSTTVTYIGRIFTGKESGDQLGGPIRTVKMAGGVTQSAIEGGGGAQVESINIAASLLQLVAYVSVAVGFLNILPIPVLDGGHLLFYGYEAVARKPLRARVQEVGYQVGLALLLGLVLFATWNDLSRPNVFKILGGLFS
ncbi:MAG TPA: M50 family metallopeptidase [Caulobacteraceae bacterium]|jgi:regulator of sigma E protease|nr:M50 family metallopeptidase [Caulobacteraceae bacterium]